ncbi:TetR/AcrR family transcriptional regulator [Desulfosporosinus fructosivorans]|uniref:TetR/AcrR family transcriptional regulator n=1 Tax=Desulfosporosinus fructosivorans TaxID=2018669 RepID=A0A4Z0QXQ9_9FIRM|nr:TetR/AcrR family transcriptional regulator [Desulfosporosinus fructosivorans]TGE35562.1 TetR/AcrR family transcriptional regulator [Desulfosporosinus fructosivorans]
MDGFERRKERKKENIRQAAFDLFSVHGMQKVSIAEIAAKANVSPVSIYNYFGSKDELLRNMISVLLDKRLQEDTEVIESSLPFREKIELFISEKTKDLSELNPDFLKLLMSADPAIRQMAEDFTKNKFIPLMFKLIEKGKEEGYINHSISNQAILLYINMFREGKHSDTFLHDVEHSKQYFKELVTLFFFGILGKPAGK